MKNVVFILGFIVLLIGIASCKSKKNLNNNSSHTQMSDNSENSLDWVGVYSGIMPCKDCGGINMKIELLNNHTYKMKYLHEGKNEEEVELSGNFSWDKSGISIQLNEGKDFNHFAVGENTLTLLDKKGIRIISDQETPYILHKVNMELVEKYWKLIEIFGESVNSNSEFTKEPHLIFKLEGNRVNGSNGCNSIKGTYTLLQGNRIQFSKMASTKMMCPNIEMEEKMTRLLDMADNYTVKNDTLVLNKARMAPLARFKAIYLR